MLEPNLPYPDPKGRERGKLSKLHLALDLKQTLGPIHMGSQVPGPAHVTKFQNEVKSQLLSLKESIKYGLYSLWWDLDHFMQKYYGDLC